MTTPSPLTFKIQSHDGIELHVRHWPCPQPRGLALMLHGLGEHGGRYEETARLFAAAGHATLLLDHRGHGLSGGPRAAILRDDNLLHDVASLWDAARERHPDLPVTLFGSSMGGVTAARFAAALARPAEDAPWRRPLQRLVLVAPALLPTLGVTQRMLLSTLGRLVPDVAVPAGIRSEWSLSDPREIQAQQDDPLMQWVITPRLARFMLDAGEAVFARAEGWAVPTLLLYSSIDRLVTPAGCERFASLAPAGLVAVRRYDDMAHDLLHEPQRNRAFDDLRSWLDQPTA